MSLYVEGSAEEGRKPLPPKSLQKPKKIQVEEGLHTDGAVQRNSKNRMSRLKRVFNIFSSKSPSPGEPRKSAGADIKDYKEEKRLESSSKLGAGDKEIGQIAMEVPKMKVPKMDSCFSRKMEPRKIPKIPSGIVSAKVVNVGGDLKRLGSISADTPKNGGNVTDQRYRGG